MADIESNIGINIDASNALSTLKELQRQISVFQTTMSKTGAVSSGRLADLQQNLINNVNATGQFTASIQRVKTTTESFTQALEKNKLSMGQYFRYAAGSTQTFGKMFRGEFDTIDKVARERVKTLQTQYIKLGRDASGAMQAIAVRPQVLDMKDLGTQTAIAAQKQQLFNQLMKQGSTNLLNFGKNTQWAGRQLMVGFTIPLGIMGAAAAREFSKIEEQVLRLERVYGDFTTTVADTEAATEQIKGLATEFTKYGIAVEKTIGLAADAAAMGQVGAGLVAQVSEATRLATLGGVSQQQALGTTISLTSAFGVATEDLAKKTDFLNAVENQTITSIEDLTEAIPKAGPVIQQLGGNVEDLTFFLTAMREGGINASESANALKSGLASLINPTGEANEMLAGFGINLQGIVEANKGNVKGIVIDFAKALDTLDPLNRAQAIEQLFGKFQFSRLSTLFQNVIAEGTQASRVLELANASSAELAALSERELGKIEDSPLYQYQGAIERFKASLAPVGEEFMKAVTPIINFGTQLLDAFNGWSDGAKQFTVIVTAAVAGIGPIFLMTFGLLANGLANIVKGALVVRTGFKGLGGQSQVLTEQIGYMNTEQLENAAIAASLNQVHSNLIQTFTSEAGAVRNLAAAYSQGVAAQNAFMGGAVSGKTKTKKFAAGGLVPGRGNGDTVPAMLTPGEFVLRKDVVERYPGLIAGMVSGNIQGYAKGGLVQAHLQGALNTSDPSVIAQIEKFYPGFSKLSESQRSMYQASGSLTADVGGKLNEALKRKAADGSVGLASDTFLQAWESVQNKLGTVAKRAGIKGSQDIIAQIETEIGQEAVKLAGAGGKVSDEILAQATTKVLKKRSRMGGESKQVADALTERANTLGDIRSAPGKVTSKGLKQGIDSGEFVVGPDNHIYPAKNGKMVSGAPPVGRVSATSGPKQSTKRVAGGYASAGSAAVIVDPEAAMLGTTRINAEKENVKETKKNTEQTKQRTTTSKKAQQQETQMMQAAQRSEAAKKGWETRRARLAEAEMAQKAKPGFKDRMSGMGRRMAGAMGPGRLGMVGMGLSSGLMMAQGVGGPVGDIAGQIAGPMMAISGVASVLGMIPGPAGLVVAALGAVAAGVIAYNIMMDNARKEGEALADAMSMTTEKMDSFAQATGKVSAAQAAAEERQLRNSVVGSKEEQTFGRSYVESDAGKSMVKDVQTMLSGGVAMKDVSSIVSNQLATAMAQGVLSKDQADSIISSLGESLNNKKLSVDMVGKLNSLVGRYGEDLEQNPMEVSVKISEQSNKDLEKQLGFLEEKLSDARLRGLRAAGGRGGGVANRETAETAKLTSQMAGLIGPAYQQSLQMSDAIKAQYTTLLAQKQAELDVATTVEDRKRLEQDILALKNQQSTALDNQRTNSQQLVAQAYQLKNTLGTNSQGYSIFNVQNKEQIKTTYADDALAQEQATQAYDKTFDNVQGGELKAQIQMEIAYGMMDPTTANTLLDAFAKDKSLESTYKAVIEQEGSQETIDLVSRLTSLDGTSEDISYALKLVEDGTMTLDQVNQQLDIIASMKELGIDVNISTDQGKLKAIQSDLDKLAQYDGQQITSAVLYDFDLPGFQMTAEAQAWFDGLPAYQQKTAAEEFIKIFRTLDTNDPADRAFLRDSAGLNKADYRDVGNKIKGAHYDYNRMLNDYATNQARSVAANTVSPGGSGFTPQNIDRGGGGGGGVGAAAQPEKPPTSFLDAVVKDIREFNQAARGLTENFQDSMAAIRAASTSAFGGLSQQLRGLGLGQDVIEMMTGMSKEDWDQYKGQFFNFDAAGNVSGFKSDLTIIAEKLRAVTLGKFVNEQQKSLATAADQVNGITKLVSLGMSYADAYKLVEDAALAAAIANAKSADEIRKIIALTQQASKAQNIADASKSLANTNAATDATVAGLNAVVRFNSALSETQLEAILASDELQTMFANFDTLNIDQLKVLKETLEDIEAKKELEIKIKMQTVEGMQELFTEGFNKAMEQFSAKEQQIKINFQVLRNPFENIVNSFTDQIEDIKNAPGGLDDLEADLQRIAEQETDVNEKYQKRFEALDKIQKINDRIAAQQRTQLSLADALSQGDIAAAARAAQEIRAQETAQALVDQREALSKSQELELESLRGQMNLSREQIEARIRDIKMQIFEIEESQIEPAQYQLDLLKRQEESQINSLTVLGKTREEWDNIKNSIDVARTTSVDYEESISRADGLISALIGGWTEIEKPKQTIYTIIEKRISDIEAAKPAPAPTPPPAPAPAAPAGPVKDQAWIDNMARRVIRGEFGNGQDRRNRLGADYQVIQDRVNAHYYRGLRLFAEGGQVTPGVKKRIQIGSAHIPMRQISEFKRYASGGKVGPMNKPSPFRIGTDTVPAMLTPGEFVVKKWAVDRFGVGNLNAINQGNFGSGSVYNYNMSVNVRSDANPDEIARTVMAQIRRVDSQRIRGNKF